MTEEPISDFLGLLGALSTGPAPDLTPKITIGGLIVSTVNTVDKGLETAILAANRTCVVERYDSEQDALAGHARWADELRAGRVTFTDVGYDELFPAEEYTLEPYPADHRMLERYPEQQPVGVPERARKRRTA